MPQFGGFCSNGINYAVPWGAGGGPNTWRDAALQAEWEAKRAAGTLPVMPGGKQVVPAGM
jgi:hypothetical protein